MMDFDSFFRNFQKHQKVTNNNLAAMNMNFQELLELQKEQMRREEERQDKGDIKDREDDTEDKRKKKQVKETQDIHRKTLDELGSIKTRFTKLFNPKIIGAAIGLAVVDAMSGANIRQAGFAAGVGAELLRVGKALKPLIVGGKEIGKTAKEIGRLGRVVGGIGRTLRTIGGVFKPIFKLLTRASIILTPIIALFTGFMRAMKTFSEGGSFTEIVMSAITGILDSLIIDLIDGITTLAGWIGKFFENLPNLLREAADPNSKTGKMWNEFTTKLGESMGKLADSIWSMLKSIFSSVWEIIWESEGKIGLGTKVAVAVSLFVGFNLALGVATRALGGLAAMSGAASVGLGGGKGGGLIGRFGRLAASVGVAYLALESISAIAGPSVDEKGEGDIGKQTGLRTAGALATSKLAGIGTVTGNIAGSSVSGAAAGAAGAAAGNPYNLLPDSSGGGATKPKTSWFGRAWNSVKRAGSAVGGWVSAGWDKIKGLAKKAKEKLLKGWVGKYAGKILRGALKIPVIGTLIESFFAGKDISAISNNPDLTAEEKKKAIGKRLGQALGGILGGVGGGILGSFIPIPVAGTLLGAIAGDFAGRWIGGVLADLLGPEKLYNMMSFMLPEVEDGANVAGGNVGGGAGAGTALVTAAGGAGTGTALVTAAGGAGAGTALVTAAGGAGGGAGTGTALVTAAAGGVGAGMMAAKESAGGDVMSDANLEEANDLIAESSKTLADELEEASNKIKESGDKIEESGDKTEKASNILTNTIEKVKGDLGGLGDKLNVKIPSEVTSKVGEFTKGIMGALGTSMSTTFDLIKGKNISEMLGSLSHASARGASRTYGFKGKGSVFGRGGAKGGFGLGTLNPYDPTPPMGPLSPDFGFPFNPMTPGGVPSFPGSFPGGVPSFMPTPGTDGQGRYLMDRSGSNAMTSNVIVPINNTTSNQVVHNQSSNTTLASGNIINEDRSIMMSMLQDNIHDSLI